MGFVKIFNGNLKKYHNWVIEYTTERIVISILSNQEEGEEICRMIYGIHKEILENNGFDKDKLREGDRKLERLIRQSKQKLCREWN